ncbi:MAG: tyrosine--tRNA ligase, partial [Deltaproteobacteria bacterium]|nr:tyrosine--tRNA ligase [Deltaproteobacteria bacterium]
MKNVYEVLCERGFVEQVSDEILVRDLLQNEKITYYIGFDPTAASLHIGSLVPIMALVHMQKCGHRPIVLIGGGTGLIGDPSGKTEMRQFLTAKDIDYNARCLQKQLSQYINFENNGAVLLNNAEWLTGLNYIEFLRDIGRHFSVNKMLAAESYKLRLETGLNFIEFNYMLLQAYDFLHLFRHCDCVLQMGGNDQWGNMLAGSDLIRRIEGKNAFSMTFPLITTALGHKMGKTEKGTVWLDAELTSPYDYYQFWINTDDADLERFLALFTFLPMDEIRQVQILTDARLNMAKAVLAFEATVISHGREAALSAWKASAAAFGVKPVDPSVLPASAIPRVEVVPDDSAICRITISKRDLEKGIPAYEL